MIKITLKSSKKNYFILKKNKFIKHVWCYNNVKFKTIFINYKQMNLVLKKGINYSEKIRKLIFQNFLRNYRQLN